MAESELRNRKGGSTAAADNLPANQEELLRSFQDKLHGVLMEKARNEGRGTTESELRQCVEEDMKKLAEGKKGPLPGLKDETKRAKDALTADPYNLQLIYELGMEYVKEEKWKEATNVMIRGWKRVSEFKEPSARFTYLYQLAECSVICKQYKQAYAILMDMEDPEDPEDLQAYSILQCKVYCENDQLQKALKAFHKALEGITTFEDALPVWTQTVFALKKVGAYEAAKSAIDRMAETEDDQNKLKVLSTMNDLKETLEKSEKGSNLPKLGVIGVLVFFLCLFTYFLYVLETRNLKSMKMK
jgi:tetratricopeptide (TPR) repeat protein